MRIFAKNLQCHLGVFIEVISLKCDGVRRLVNRLEAGILRIPIMIIAMKSML